VLVLDLGLLRVPHKESSSFVEEALHKSMQKSIIKSTKSAEDKRALLGYFVLRST
jgi:hypothetical protein